MNCVRCDLNRMHGAQGYYGAFAAGAQTVMASYNSWNDVAAGVNYGKMHGSKAMLTDVLKDKMGFDGFVVTDYTGIAEMTDHGMGDTQTVAALALNAGVLEKKMSIVHPGVTLPETVQSPSTIQSFKKKHGLEQKKILLSVGRLTTRKGLKEFVESSLAYIVQQEPNVILVVVGESPKNSLGAGLQTREEILEVARQNQVENHILFLGVITDNEQLATVYEAADVHVFPVRHIPDDPEGFGMVAIEAAAHSLPTVAFATGGIVDAVENGVSGYLVEKDNYVELTQQVLFVLNNPLDRQMIQMFSHKFAWESFGRKSHKTLCI